MKGVLASILTTVALLLAISSCATVPEGPLEPGEMRLLSLEVPENGNLKVNVAYPVAIKFKAEGRPEVRRACFTWNGDGPRCNRIKDVKYGSEASLDVLFYAPMGYYRLECYVEYVRDGKVRRTNIVGSYVNGLM